MDLSRLRGKVIIRVCYYKAKVEKSEQGEIKKLEGNYGTGYGLRVQAVLYSSSNPGNFLHLYDADGDEFLFPISGQRKPKGLINRRTNSCKATLELFRYQPWK